MLEGRSSREELVSLQSSHFGTLPQYAHLPRLARRRRHARGRQLGMGSTGQVGLAASAVELGAVKRVTLSDTLC